MIYKERALLPYWEYSEVMVSNKSGKKPTMSITREYGYFQRIKTRRGTKKRQKTIRLKNNPEKVVIDRIGDLEFYVYPYSFPDRLFIGIYPMSTSIEIEDFKRLFGIMNKIRWYLEEDWVNKPKTEKGAKFLRKRIVKAYNIGLDKLKKAKSPSL